MQAMIGVVSGGIVNMVMDPIFIFALGMGVKGAAVATVIFPAAKSGIMAAVILGIGRAIGETMAVIMVAGNQPRMPKGILKGVRTLTSNIVTEMGYAEGLHYEALIATAVVLFVFILILNVLFSIVSNKAAPISFKRKKVKKEEA